MIDELGEKRGELIQLPVHHDPDRLEKDRYRLVVHTDRIRPGRDLFRSREHTWREKKCLREMSDPLLGEVGIITQHRMKLVGRTRLESLTSGYPVSDIETHIEWTIMFDTKATLSVFEMFHIYADIEQDSIEELDSRLARDLREVGITPLHIAHLRAKIMEALLGFRQHHHVSIDSDDFFYRTVFWFLVSGF